MNQKLFFEETGKEKEYVDWWLEKQKQRRDETLTMHNLTFQVSKEVFSPSTETTHSVEVLLKHFPEVNNKRVLEIGTGCGVLALYAAENGASEVIATDIFPAALENAEQNVELRNQKDIVQVVNTDRFEDLSGTFDVIIMNIIFADQPEDESEAANERTESLTLHRRLLGAAEKMLPTDGIIYLGFGSFGDIKTLQTLMNESGLMVDCVTEEKFEVNWYSITLKKA